MYRRRPWGQSGVRVQGVGSLLGLLLLQCCGEGGDVVGGEVGEGGL